MRPNANETLTIVSSLTNGAAHVLPASAHGNARCSPTAVASSNMKMMNMLHPLGSIKIKAVLMPTRQPCLLQGQPAMLPPCAR